MRLYSLEASFEVSYGIAFSEIIVAICTSVDEAKQIAERLSNNLLKWNCDDDPDYPLWEADTHIETTDGIFDISVTVYYWQIVPASLNKVLRSGWNLKPEFSLTHLTEIRK